MPIKTAGELRGFLADILVAIRAGEIDVSEATAIAKVAGQINQSLAVECKTAIELKRMGEGGHVAGSMLIASGESARSIMASQQVWCDQCDAMVDMDEAKGCKSKYCKARPK